MPSHLRRLTLPLLALLLIGGVLGINLRRAAAGYLPAAPPAPPAATIVVTSTADGTLAALSGNGTCDLREAIEAANTNAMVGQCVAGMTGADTITFAPAVTGTITLTQGELTVSEALTIQGPGANLLTISGNHASRVFSIAAGSFDVTFSHLTIANGRAKGTDISGGGFNIDITGFAGGIHNQSTGALTITNSTLAGNSAVGGAASGGSVNFGGFGSGGGIDNLSTGPVKAGNTIIANNTASSNDPDVSGRLTSDGYNLIENPSGATITPAQPTDIFNVDPQLGPLQNNGGPTMTHRPLTGSPVIDKGNSFGLTTDQRGFLRPQDNPAIANAAGGDGADIGAVELFVDAPAMNMIQLVIAPSTNPAGAAQELISAINQANDDPAPTTIKLVCGTYTLTARNDTYYGFNGLPVITTPVIIQGNGAVIERRRARRRSVSSPSPKKTRRPVWRSPRPAA
jgi:CSLREA domain-containing protein